MNELAEASKVFLSYATEDEPVAGRFRQLAWEEVAGLTFYDCAVRDGFNENWRQEALEKIAASDVVACLVGETTYLSEPVNWEIETADRLGKKTVAYAFTPVAVLPTALWDSGVEVRRLSSQPSLESAGVV